MFYQNIGNKTSFPQTNIQWQRNKNIVACIPAL